ncbi:hypothetical protein HWX16_15895 [Ochrobactrum intermedium]|uniref:hypothetical protein n=1 Tax=Brucella intermedia TaxID=94625 RepID=UPI00159C9086|nr:hypothetical protein [Brucella intermedia]NVM41811.1 hypothetical protein [Brucella intermedia]
MVDAQYVVEIRLFLAGLLAVDFSIKVMLRSESILNKALSATSAGRSHSVTLDVPLINPGVSSAVQGTGNKFCRKTAALRLFCQHTPLAPLVLQDYCATPRPGHMPKMTGE